MRQEAVKVENIFQVYNDKTVVKDVSFSIKEGEFISLLGPSGCGKTTTLRVIAGFVKPTEGTVMGGGPNITHGPPEKRNVGFVFQNYALWPHMTVGENIMFGLKLRRYDKQKINSIVDRMLEITGLDGLSNRLPRQLSGGQQQRVSLARAIALEPEVLLLDEPLSNLDRSLRIIMRRELKELQQRLNMTTLFVTHDQEEALSMSDRIILMKDGGISRIATPHELYDDPRDDFIADFTGHTNFFEAQVIKSDENQLKVQVDNFTLTLPPSEYAETGEMVRLMLRPERVRLSSSTNHPNEITLNGTIQLIEYFGCTIHYKIKLDNGRTLHVESHNTSQEHKINDRIDVFVNPDHFRLILGS